MNANNETVHFRATIDFHLHLRDILTLAPNIDGEGRKAVAVEKAMDMYMKRLQSLGWQVGFNAGEYTMECVTDEE